MPKLTAEQAAEPAAIGQAQAPLGPMGPTMTFGEVDLRETLRKIWRRKGVIFGTAILLTSLAGIVVFQLTPRYTAETVLMIEPRQSKVIDIKAVLEGLPADTETITSEIEVIRSRGLAGKVIDRLGLDREPEFNETLRPPGWFDELTEALGIPVQEGLAILRGARNDEDLSDEEMRERERVRVIDTFLENLNVAPKGRSRIIKVAFTSESPRTAAKVANVLADLYIVEQLEAKFEATKRAAAWLNDRLASSRETVEASEKAVEAFRRKSGLLESKGTTITSQQASELNTQLILATAERAGAEARLQQINKLMSSVDGVESVAEVLDSLLIQRLREQEAEVEREAAELFTEYGERHPKMINVRAEMRDLQAKIKAEVSKIIKGLENNAGVARAREASLARSLKQLKGRVAESNKAEVRLRALEREAQANRLLLETMLSRFKETQVQENLQAQQPDARIISRADVPELPSFPKKKLILALTLVGSLFVGLMLVFAIEQLDSGFRSGEQIEQLTGVPVLGLVPKRNWLKEFGTTPENHILEQPISAFAESMRTLHTSIVLSQVDQPPKCILFASTQPEEGKTTIAVCLARMLARSGKKVLLIDADLRRPGIHQILRMPVMPGLVDLLWGNATREEVIRTDRASGAYVITAGQLTANAANILSSEQMKALLVEFGLAYDMVILDSPPLLAVSDARVLAGQVDQTVFVVRWAETRRERVCNALKQLTSSGAKLAGVVLSMVDVRKHARYGYGDSGYYYGPARKYYTG